MHKRNSRFCRGCARYYPLGYAHCPKCGTATQSSVQLPNVSGPEAFRLEGERVDRERFDPDKPVERFPDDFSPEIRGFIEAWEERD